MNRRPLRLTRPGQLPAPATGQDSLHVLTERSTSSPGCAPPAGSATPSGCTP